MATSTDSECATSTTISMSIEQLLKDQMEETRVNLVEMSNYPEADEVLRSFTRTAAAIVEWWQTHAKDENLPSFQVDFGKGPPLTLLMILALLPEDYQFLICIDDEHRSPSSNGENLSWLHEQTTDALVRLNTYSRSAPILFGQGLASMIRDDVDEGWQAFTGRSWLEDQVHLLSNGDLEPDLYRFPPGTERIVFLFNPTGIHWTVVEVNLRVDGHTWMYTLYDSLTQSETGPIYSACAKQFPVLEDLICSASRFKGPRTRGLRKGASAQQKNPYDCGPIAIYNAIELAEGRTPNTRIDPEYLRLKFLQQIHKGLYLLDEELEPSVVRLHMR